jgi:nucleotide-binding universal stress UspA family protein
MGANIIADGYLACLAHATVRYCTLPGGSCAETRNNDMYKNILIATDGSDLSANAVKQGVTLAKTLAAKVTAVNVSEPFHWFDPNMVEGAEDAYRQASNQAAARVLDATTWALKELWAKVANESLERTGDEGRAIREANAVVARQAEAS